MAQERNRNDETGEKPDEDQLPHHIADEPVTEPQNQPPETHSPVTPTGIPIEEQIEKEWDPNKDGGLPTFLRIDR